MNDLAGEMQNFNLKLDKQTCSLCHWMLPWGMSDEKSQIPGIPVINSAHQYLKPFSCSFSIPFCKAHLNCCWVLSCKFMESPTHSTRLLNGSGLEFAIGSVDLALFLCTTLKKILCFQHWFFLTCISTQPLSWGVCLFSFVCLILLISFFGKLKLSYSTSFSDHEWILKGTNSTIPKVVSLYKEAWLIVQFFSCKK